MKTNVVIYNINGEVIESWSDVQSAISPQRHVLEVYLGDGTFIRYDGLPFRVFKTKK